MPISPISQASIYSGKAAIEAPERNVRGEDLRADNAVNHYAHIIVSTLPMSARRERSSALTTTGRTVWRAEKMAIGIMRSRSVGGVDVVTARTAGRTSW